jgi:hypothetical protein
LSPNLQQGRFLHRPGLREVAIKHFNVNLAARKAINTSLYTSAIVLFLASFTLVPFAAVTDVELIENGSIEESEVTSLSGWTTYFGQNYTSGLFYP